MQNRNGMKFLIKFATRQRPEIFKNTFSRYVDYLSGLNEYEIIVSCDIDDILMNNNQMIDFIKSHDNASVFFSNRINKIDALNRDVDKACDDWQIIISGTDDMVPVARDYDKIISDKMNQYFSDTDGLLWFYEGFRKDIIVSFAMGRKYYDRFGWLYYPGYQSMRADCDMTSIAKILGRYKYFDQCLMEHRHHSFKKPNSIAKDDLYIENHKSIKQDRQVYAKRKNSNFGLVYKSK